MILAIILNIINNVIGKILNFEVKIMRNVLSKKESEFITSLTLNEKSKNTIEKYARDIRDFILWCEENGIGAVFLEKLDKEVLIKYKLYMKNKYDKVSTINSKISSINAFLDYSNMQNLKIRIIKCQKSLFGNKDRQLTRNELKRLLDAAYKKKDKRIYYLMLVIARTGIRVSEVKYITVDAVRDGKAIVDNKGKVRPVIIPKKLCKLLIDYCKNHDIKKGSVFITRNGNAIDRKNIWQEMKDLCEKAHVDSKKVFPHNLRHLFAREFYKETKDIVKLASILGHSSIETTSIYTKEDIDNCIELIENLDFIDLCKT